MLHRTHGACETLADDLPIGARLLAACSIEQRVCAAIVWLLSCKIGLTDYGRGARRWLISSLSFLR
jgi:hypothetical protein